MVQITINKLIFNRKFKKDWHLWLFVAYLLVNSFINCYDRRSTTQKNPFTRRFCVQTQQSLRARHKTCFLRPDTGPCRADIVQWYYDVRQSECYRFFWGGCQGNGNRFETKYNCQDYCFLNITSVRTEVPFFCSLAFDYGSCFGYYNRWGWDRYSQACKPRLYSGCGGNQNNFQNLEECRATCLRVPNNTLNKYHQYTTCIPFNIEDIQ